MRSPRTNGFVERMNRMLLDECLRVQGRQTWYIGVDEIQRDPDTFLRHYYLKRSHKRLLPERGRASSGFARSARRRGYPISSRHRRKNPPPGNGQLNTIPRARVLGNYETCTASVILALASRMLLYAVKRRATPIVELKLMSEIWLIIATHTTEGEIIYRTLQSASRQ